MKISNRHRIHYRKRAQGMTLLEITVVITVMLALIAVLWIGASAWKAGSDRSSCIVNIRNVQLAARSYQNMYAIPVGDEFQSDMVVGPTTYIGSPPKCNAGGKYKYAETFPATGNLFLNCDQASHVPENFVGW